MAPSLAHFPLIFDELQHLSDTTINHCGCCSPKSSQFSTTQLQATKYGCIVCFVLGKTDPLQFGIFNFDHLFAPLFRMIITTIHENKRNPIMQNDAWTSFWNRHCFYKTYYVSQRINLHVHCYRRHFNASQELCSRWIFVNSSMCDFWYCSFFDKCNEEKKSTGKIVLSMLVSLTFDWLDTVVITHFCVILSHAEKTATSQYG